MVRKANQVEKGGVNIFKKFYIEYDRNGHEGGDARIAGMLLSAASDGGGLYVDFYAIPDEITNLPPNKYVGFNTAAEELGVLSKLLSIKEISAYVCVQVDSPQQLRALWKDYSYSSPKIYRVVNEVRTAQEAALSKELVEKFQWASLDELAMLLETNICVFRDFHDEVGLEIVCLESMEKKMKYLITIYLGLELNIV